MARRSYPNGKHKYTPLCGCGNCEREALRRSGGDNRGGGLHVGRPHISKNDPRIHVTSTLRDGNGKKVRNDRHHSTLGAIAYGQTAYEENRKKS